MTKQYYFDLLPLRVQPRHLESFTGYLTRLAEMNGISSISALAATCSFDERAYGRPLREMKDYPPLSFGNLSIIAGCPEAKLLQTTFYHLGKKFGRSMESFLFSGFLARSLSRSLRYCPICLSEASYYSLVWRFLALSGCHKHDCKLFNGCKYCGESIPFLAHPLRIGICPACKGDLSLCEPEALTEEESREAFVFSQEVEFLLSPQLWENTYTFIEKNIGREYTLLRQIKGYTNEEGKSQLMLKNTVLRNFAPIDFGRSKGTTFKDYVIYAKYLGISLKGIFDLMLTRTEEDTSFEKIRREFLPPEEDVLEKVRLIVGQLEAKGEQVTRQAIREGLYMAESSLRRYPQVKDFLDQHAGGYHYRNNKKIQLRIKEVLEDVLAAIRQLSDLGKPITYASVSILVGLSAGNLKAYPQAVALIKQHGNIRESHKEDELLERVKEAMGSLMAEGQKVTQVTLARAVGVSRVTFQEYPRVVHLLEEHTKIQAQLRESKMLMKVKEAITVLESENCKLTIEMICQHMGIDSSNLRHYSSAISFAREVTKEKQRQYKEKQFPIEEERLVHAVSGAIQQLQSQGLPVTLAAVAKMLHIGKKRLKGFPKVKLILNEAGSLCK